MLTTSLYSDADVVLRGLYDRALAHSPRLFRAQADSVLKQYLHFDMGFWATGDLFRGMMTLTEWNWGGIPDFQAATQTKQFLEILRNRHGIRIDSVDEQPEFVNEPFYLSDLGPRNIQHVIALSQIDNQGQLRDIVLIGRRDPKQVWTEAERELARRLGPFLFHAAGVNLQATLVRHMGSSHDAAYCVCDGSGHIYSYSDTLEEMLIDRVGNVPAALPLNFSRRAKQQSYAGLLVSINPLDYARRATDQFFIVGLRPSNGLERLSQREMQLASAVCHNHTYKRIAYDLNLSPSTVGNVMSRVYKKLGIKGRAELVDLMGYGMGDD